MARDFDGVDDVVGCGSGTTVDNIFSTSIGSCFLWTLPDSIGENFSGRFFVKVSPNIGGYMAFISTTSKFTFFTYAGANTGRWDTTNNDLTLDAWNSIGMTYLGDAGTNDPIFFINGTKKTVGSGITEADAPGIMASDANYDLRIGNTNDTTRTFNGYICEIVFFKQQTIPDNYFAALGRGVNPFALGFDIAVYLPLWGNDSTEGDLSGNGNHGTVTGTTKVPHSPTEHISNYISGYC